jgi:alkylation response protein AidB-like acyl-CoA dehydrogenase
MGTEGSGAAALLALLRLIGGANLSLGRIFEGHVNALQLVARYGHAEQVRQVAADAAEGHLFAVWVTEAADPVSLTGAPPRLQLRGSKHFCSAAALATRALITAAPEAGPPLMLLVALRAGAREAGARARLGGVETTGMRGCGTGAVDLSGLEVQESAIIGQPGDYLRQPTFSAGAWRASAVALGGLEALADATRRQLLARGRDTDPHQRARLGRILIDVETAALWIAKAARIAEADEHEAGDVAGYVNLARCAIEAACLDTMRLAHQSLGLAAFVRGNPVELLSRDLATYLRQPAPDEALTEAAGWFIARTLPQLADAPELADAPQLADARELADAGG